MIVGAPSVYLTIMSICSFLPFGVAGLASVAVELEMFVCVMPCLFLSAVLITPIPSASSLQWSGLHSGLHCQGGRRRLALGTQGKDAHLRPSVQRQPQHVYSKGNEQHCFHLKRNE